MPGNLPPGVSVSDIPGNRPEDEAWDDLFNWLMDSGLEPKEIRDYLSIHWKLTNPRIEIR
jgi:hypothetical protein